ncbi:hypothetical protein LGV61_05065 [Desulfurispirillum indicum]|uniref:hypothetical protein n=1 Tax=Desulfurispirillum indicum TaxID=936456 RepID=UPI001CFA72A9|nr:hypothetical protein [Desulfurispirillum indicum]UCZ57649.1 hypothetical protein LGV61_05065 [Desulfurispirillum indicum]
MRCARIIQSFILCLILTGLTIAGEKNNCPDAQVELFGVSLKCADRETVWEALKHSKVTVKSQNLQNWCDSYHSSAALQGSSELQYCYTYEDEFATARYTFPGRMDTQLVVTVRDMVANRYGQPTRSSGNTSVGQASFSWHIRDGIEIRVHRGWPDTTTYLSYIHTANNAVMERQLEQQRQQQQQQQHERQSDAF